ncbi:TPA: NUDIX hydrolase [Listeria monocytogenes]|uniref:NUDIX domain-containing protein n=2 Tax=Listeria monocytogenes TaxID=1639 RepID=A0A5D5MJN0_LISMN|nr:NUDIX hydrolase [Listeria monocytogenes]EAF4537326.1 NUDIX hydrolase [Listeria monocytogenes serotype 1/2a]EEP3929972.1 NUDIX hydrolase [Listeria monocytogenes serotype 4ab]EFD89814.1 MutT/nudix family protein [Listeria monocytogenes FSL J2-071]EHC6211353.1 NUDIX hydrolase [Listeria monocytogenes serotype 1/2b]MCY63306.1 NUDIX hydrolase [Listeria monocytogenes serotype 4c]MDA19224.1 NUDIX hydrolase [Listeria monocytogenes serotype 4a]
MKRSIHVQAFVYNEKKDEILVVRDRNLAWAFPGGQVETNQTMEEALASKVKEQTNIDIEIESILHCKERRATWEHVCTFVFRAKPVGSVLLASNDDNVFRVKWIPIPLADDLLAVDQLSLNELVRSEGVLYENYT